MRTGTIHNPFSACYLDPDRFDYIFPAGYDISLMADRMEIAKWQGELCGSRGTGKSTLLHTLRREVERRGKRSIYFRCSEQERDLPTGWWWMLGNADVAFLDGGEMLRFGQLQLLLAGARLFKKGLMLTTHKPLEFGYMQRVGVRPEQFVAMVGAVLKSAQMRVSDEDCAALLHRHHGNARAALFELYDYWESAEHAGIFLSVEDGE